MAQRLLSSTLEVLGSLKAFLATRAGRRIQWLVTVAFIAGSLVVAGRSLHHIDGFASWGYAYITLALIPLGFSVMALQYFIAGWSLGVPLGFEDSLRVASAATAANLLPVPGAVLVRVGALKSRGVAVKVATAMTASVAFAVLSMSTAVAGVCLAPTSAWLALSAVAVAVVSAAACIQLIPGSVSNRGSVVVRLLAVGLYVAIVNGVNLFAVFQMIGQDISLAASIAIAASGVLASSVGVIPGGLGVRELTAGALSLALGYDPGVVVSAVIISRFAEIVGLVALQIHFRPSKALAA